MTNLALRDVTDIRGRPRQSLSRSTRWATLVAAELVAATKGLGFMIKGAADFLVTDVVILGILVIATVAIVMEMGLRVVQRVVAPWQGRE